MPIRQPNFLYAGASKSGSSWIYEILREHPEAFVPGIKDVYFFDRYYERGLDWYFSLFAEAGDAKAVGEVSHDYFLSEECAERIRRDLPQVRILFCLRERLDLTFSSYLYDKTLFQYFPAERYTQGLSFEEFAQHPKVQALSDYCRNLRFFLDRFPRERILVLFYDDLQRDPAGFARRLYEFLGVDPDFVPPSLHRRINVARRARSRFLAHLAYQGGQLLRRLGRPEILGSIKRRSWFERLLYRPWAGDKNKPTIPDDMRHRLHAELSRDYDRLADLIGQPLPPAWGRSMNSGQ